MMDKKKMLYHCFAIFVSLSLIAEGFMFPAFAESGFNEGISSDTNKQSENILVSDGVKEKEVNPIDKDSEVFTMSEQKEGVLTGDEKGYVGPYKGYDGHEYEEVLFLNKANFPDDNFRECLIDYFKAENVVTVRDEQKPFLTKIYLEKYVNVIDTRNMKHTSEPYDFTGLEYFKNIEKLQLESKAVDGEKAAYWVKVKDPIHLKNSIKSMERLQYLSLAFCNTVDMTGLDLSQNKELKETSIIGGILPDIDLSNNSKLVNLNIYQVGLLKAPALPIGLRRLSLENIEKEFQPEIFGKPNQFTEIDVSALKDLECIIANRVETLTKVKLGDKPNLQFVHLDDCRVSTIDTDGIKPTDMQKYFHIKNNRTLYYIDLSKYFVPSADGNRQQIRVFGNRLLGLDLPEKVNSSNMRVSSYQNYRGSSVTPFALEVEAPKKGEPLKLDTYVPNFKYNKIIKDGSEYTIRMMRYKKGGEKIEIYKYNEGKDVDKTLKMDGYSIGGISVSDEGITGVEPNTFVTYYYDTGAKVEPLGTHYNFTEPFYLPVLLYVKGYTVKYNFVSVTSGKDLPEDVMKLCPQIDNVAKGDEVSPPEIKNSEINVDGGKWRFDGWTLSDVATQPAPLKVTIKDKNVVFIGHWKFIGNNDNPSNPSIPTYPKNEPPVLTVKNKTIKPGESLDLMTLVVSAIDKEDGDLTKEVKLINDGGFNKDKVSKYIIIFKVSDKNGASDVKEAVVTVIEDDKKESKPDDKESIKDSDNDKSEKPNYDGKITQDNSVPRTGYSIDTPVYIGMVAISGILLIAVSIIKRRKIK